MARPAKHNAEFFTHDADMRNDIRIKALRQKYRLDGYAIWNMMLELLTDKDYFEVEWTALNRELIAGDFGIETDYLVGLIDYCIQIELFVIEENKLSSKTHKRRFETLLSKRERQRNRVIADDNERKPESKTEPADENTHSIVEYSIVKESKVEYSKEENNNTHTLDLNKKNNAREMKVFRDGHLISLTPDESVSLFDLLSQWQTTYAPCTLTIPNQFDYEGFYAIAEKYDIADISRVLHAMNNSTKLANKTDLSETLLDWLSLDHYVNRRKEAVKNNRDFKEAINRGQIDRKPIESTVLLCDNKGVQDIYQYWRKGND